MATEKSKLQQPESVREKCFLSVWHRAVTCGHVLHNPVCVTNSVRSEVAAGPGERVTAHESGTFRTLLASLDQSACLAGRLVQDSLSHTDLHWGCHNYFGFLSDRSPRSSIQEKKCLECIRLTVYRSLLPSLSCLLTARKAFCIIICISHVRKYASQMNKNHEPKEIGTFYRIEFLKCEK